MAWFFVGLALLLLLVAALYWLAYADAKSAGKALAAVVLVLLLVVTLALALSGRLGAALPVLLSLGWGLLRWKALVRTLAARASWFQPGGAASEAGSQSTTVRTEWLEMTLDHATGTVEGTVLKGSAAGRALSSLDLAALLDLHRALMSEDPEGRRLLEAYLDRVHGADWRPAAGAAGGENAGASAPQGAGMTDAEALAILGLEPGADRAAIKRAHRRMMQKLHPDHGGSDYFAAKINAAKEHLLKGRR